MAKDYAKMRNHKRRPPSRSSRKSRSHGRLWLVACVLAVLFIVGLFYLKQQAGKMVATERSEPIKKTVEPTSSSSIVKPVEKHGEKTAQPRFDFYTMLPNEQTVTTTLATQQSITAEHNEKVSVEHTAKTSPSLEPTIPARPTLTARQQIAAMTKQQLELVKVDVTTTSSPTVKPLATRYLLQLGFFKDYETADEQKANLLLQGVEVKLKTLKKNGVSYYRLWLGPYKSVAEATKAQQKLKAEQVKSSVIKEG